MPTNTSIDLTPQRRLELARVLSKLDRLTPDEPLPTLAGGRLVGDAYRIGITGPVGAGKSTLINRLARAFREARQTVGIIAIDPSSPFTGGAVLGDRVRMTELALDDGVFIRSLATRGAFGGLALSAIDAADLLDAFGFDRVIIETVGVGQTEVDIVEACDATVVVLEPAAGDDVQAIKAGLMEIADLFVVNKADLKGSQRFIMDLETAIDLRDLSSKPKVLGIQATSGEGLPGLVDWLETFYRESSASGALAKRRAGQRAKRIRRAAEGVVIRRLWEMIPSSEVEDAATGNLPVRDAAHRIVGRFAKVTL